MPAQGGTGGTVTSYGCSDTAGKTATVSYPGDATVQPPVPPHTETYHGLSDDEWETFKSAKHHDEKVDTTCDTAGNVTGVTAT